MGNFESCEGSFLSSIDIEIKLPNLDPLKSKIIKAIDKGLDDLADYIFQRSQELCPMDEGRLKDSGIVRKDHLSKVVGYAAPHSIWLEFGTGPHTPPLEPLRKWVWRKRKDLGISEKQVERVARRIQKKIAKEGTEPQPYLRPAFDEGMQAAVDILAGHIRDEIKTFNAKAR
jgi:uncharacterized protein YjiS (DUF1127 family)